ncbi:hypothetical protein [Burkholderia sp. Ac-20392]|uniref:hypothetical protein n=1 Tax=Burkholderia sp. Ac-20392 TaxID=2703905 RepID=UPI003216DB02
MALREIERSQVGFTGFNLSAGKNVVPDCLIFIRIRRSRCDIGLREPLDAWCAVSICHEEPALSQYVNLRPVTIWSLLYGFFGRRDMRANRNLPPPLVLRHITHTQAFLYNAPAFRQG